MAWSFLILTNVIGENRYLVFMFILNLQVELSIFSDAYPSRVHANICCCSLFCWNVQCFIIFSSFILFIIFLYFVNYVVKSFLVCLEEPVWPVSQKQNSLMAHTVGRTLRFGTVALNLRIGRWPPRSLRPFQGSTRTKLLIMILRCHLPFSLPLSYELSFPEATRCVRSTDWMQKNLESVKPDIEAICKM